MTRKNKIGHDLIFRAHQSSIVNPQTQSMWSPRDKWKMELCAKYFIWWILCRWWCMYVCVWFVVTGDDWGLSCVVIECVYRTFPPPNKSRPLFIIHQKQIKQRLKSQLRQSLCIVFTNFDQVVHLWGWSTDGQELPTYVYDVSWALIDWLLIPDCTRTYTVFMDYGCNVLFYLLLEHINTGVCDRSVISQMNFVLKRMHTNFSRNTSDVVLIGLRESL